MLVTLLSVFLGAFLAFKLEDESKKRKEIKNNIAAANGALFTLMRQLNSLKLFQRDMIDPLRSDPAISVNMDPLLEELSEDRVDFPSLNYVLGSKHKNVVVDIYILQQRYIEAMKAINHRSKLHYQKVQPKLASSNLIRGESYEKGEIIDILGLPLFEELERITEQVVKIVDDTIDSSEDILKEFIAALKKIHPKGNYFGFTVKNDSEF